MINAEDFMQLLKTRRSIRSFLKTPVPKEDIEKIITAASWAPSGSNQQNWHFTIIVSQDIKIQMMDALKQELEEINGFMVSAKAKETFNTYSKYFTFFSEAPVIIAVIKKTYESLAERILGRYKLSKKIHTTAGIQGPSAAIQNLILMAHVLGYGTCWMTGPLIAREKLEKTLNINSPDELLALIPLGIPAKTVSAVHRKKIEEILNYL